MLVTKNAVAQRFLESMLESRMMDNAMRGFWCEHMVALALGKTCRHVALGWNPWDLEMGDPGSVFPERIRIQVKNSASTQMWNEKERRVTASNFDLKWRSTPAYSGEVRETGFLCEVFILCHHPIEDYKAADHADPSQWDFYVFPVVGPFSAVTAMELDWLRKSHANSGNPASIQRRPATMRRGIRNRRPVEPVGIEQLNAEAIRASCGLEAGN